MSGGSHGEGDGATQQHRPCSDAARMDPNIALRRYFVPVMEGQQDAKGEQRGDI
ncbi:MAG: hypothetical protein ACXVXI_00380 [Mycobacteriaceae bacterium]